MNTGRQSPGLPYGSLIFYLSFFFLGGGGMFGIFTNALLWSTQQSSPFIDAFRGKKVKLVI